MKSEKAKKYIEGHKWKERETCPLENVRVYIAEEAIEIAEAEMREKGIEAFKIWLLDNYTEGGNDKIIERHVKKYLIELDK